MGAEENIVRMGTNFARIMLGGNATVFMHFSHQRDLSRRGRRRARDAHAVAGQRAQHRARSVLHFRLGPFPEMGVTGARVATNIGRGTGVLYQLWHLAANHSRVRVRSVHLRPVPADARRDHAHAGNGIAQLMISTTSWVGLFKILAVFGSSAIAGYTIAIPRAWFRSDAGVGPGQLPARRSSAESRRGQTRRARRRAVKIATRFNMIFLASSAGVRRPRPGLSRDFSPRS
jgi:Na+-driven multidrug efflux pump